MTVILRPYQDKNVCNKCGLEKDIQEFAIRKDCKSRRRLACNTCRYKQTKSWKENNRERRNELNRLSHARCRDGVNSRRRERYKESDKTEHKERTAKWRNKNLDYIRAVNKKWREENKERQKITARAWIQNNRARVREKWQRREARKMRAVPSWANLDAIRLIYNKAEGVGYHVDHIVPLHSKIVCGLHCEVNLQLLPPIENKRKSNIYWPDMP